MVILPIYTEQERKELKPEFLLLMKWIEDNEMYSETEEYKEKFEKACDMYEVINNT